MLAFIGLAAEERIPDNPPKDFAGVAAPPVRRDLAEDWLNRTPAVTLAVWDGEPSALQAGVHRDLPADAMAAGEWMTTASGERVWRLAIHSTGAASLRLRFAVSRKSGRIRLLAPGHESSYEPESGFWSDVVNGPAALVEFTPDSSSDQQLPFRVETASHGFSRTEVCPRDDVSCSGIWRDSRRGVAVLRYEQGGASYECGAWLINTRTGNGAPYLMAGCGVDAAAVTTAVVVFDSGEQLRAADVLAPGPDFSLLSLDAAPRNAFFFGWSVDGEGTDLFPRPASGMPAVRGAGIVTGLIRGDAVLPFSSIYPVIRSFVEDGEPCKFELDGGAAEFTAAGGDGEVAVGAPAHCRWSVASNAGWLRIADPGPGEGGGVIRFVVAGNASQTARESVIALAGETFQISQRGVSGRVCEQERMEIGAPISASLDTDCLSTVRPGRFARRFTFSGQKDQRIVIAAESSAFDAYVYLLDGTNKVLIEDDDGGEGAASRIPSLSGSFALPYTGTYALEVTSSGLAAVGDFRLAACPGQTPIAMLAGQTVSGTLTLQSCLSTQFYTQLYSFQGVAGQQAAITMTSTAIDSYLIVTAPGGTVVGEDDDSAGNLNARVPGFGFLTLPQSGTYVIEASTWVPFQTGGFTLSLTLNSTGGGGGGGGGAVTPARLVAVTPCRVADTRPGQGTSGVFGPPSLAAGQVRDLPIPSSNCGIPTGAKAYSLNITVIPRSAALGFLTVWPSGQTRPVVSTLNSFDGRIVANAAIVPASAAGSISVYVTDAADVIVDINGYFAP
ncbi:MAG: hypothetical protein SFV51_23050 [Bryobacteraceae bacterium]|nr:hypothetical protein [Bryobacteraceae bacterium]